MFNPDRKYYLRLSENTGFHKDVIEKVHRLLSIIEYINSNAFLKDRLVLKGGTALNLTVFALPRLSVDIDLDFHSYNDRETVLKERVRTKDFLYSYLEREGYHISQKSKDVFALESIVATYENNAGNPDNIKIETNYSLRHHIFPTVMRKVNTELFGTPGEVRTLNIIELLASKTAALFNRLAARDFYDIYNVARQNILSEDDYACFCDALVFYGSITGEIEKLTFSPERVDQLRKKTIYQNLYPMLIKSERLDLDLAKVQVKNFLFQSLQLKPSHRDYMEAFAKGDFKPELLFSNAQLENIKAHPMAIWKTNKRKQK